MLESITRLVSVPGAELEVIVHGSGDPVVLIQTALVADEFVPIVSEAVLHDHMLVHYHRRGYAGSSVIHGPGSLLQDAVDCDALLAALGIARAHVVGLSYSAAVALQLAVDAPERVHSLTLIEPPPVHVSSAAEFVAANRQIMHDRRSRGSAAALDGFLARVIGSDWRTAMECRVPGAVEQVERDVATFFDTDLPALLNWRFGPEDARVITQPVMHIGGSDSGPWFAEVRELILRWLPAAEDVVLPGADHSLAMTHPGEVATAIADFLSRHPMSR